MLGYLTRDGRMHHGDVTGFAFDAVRQNVGRDTSRLRCGSGGVQRLLGGGNDVVAVAGKTFIAWLRRLAGTGLEMAA